MDYLQQVKEHRAINLYSQLRGPVLVRVDINLPVANGKIAEDTLRLQVYGNVLELYSQYAGIVVMAHQGRSGDDDFTSLKEHHRMLLGMLPRNVDVEFVPKDSVFTQETKKKISELKSGQIMLLDNVRYFDFEKKFDAADCPYIDFFKGAVKTCINDSIPTWHRADASMVALPHIAKTLLGLPSMRELQILEGIRESKEKKALISGGKKPEKAANLKAIHNDGVDGFTGGVVGQAIARARGHDLGKVNNDFIQHAYDLEGFKEVKTIASLPNVMHPVDFTVVENGEAKNIELNDLKSSNGRIVDIGAGTVEKYAILLEEKEIRIRAGPLGRYEEGFSNGIELTKRIAGNGLVFLGGNTSQEVIESGLASHIRSAGGEILISGGSAIHRLADGTYPSLDEILKIHK